MWDCQVNLTLPGKNIRVLIQVSMWSTGVSNPIRAYVSRPPSLHVISSALGRFPQDAADLFFYEAIKPSNMHSCRCLAVATGVLGSSFIALPSPTSVSIAINVIWGMALAPATQPNPQQRTHHLRVAALVTLNYWPRKKEDWVEREIFWSFKNKSEI